MQVATDLQLTHARVTKLLCYREALENGCRLVCLPLLSFLALFSALQGMEASPLDGEIPRYLAPGIALFEVVDDDLLPIKPIGIQVIQLPLIAIPMARKTY